MGPFGDFFGLILQDMMKRMALEAFIFNNQWMTAGEKDFTAYPQLWGDCENIAAEHRGKLDEDLSRGEFYSTVGMFMTNHQNPEMAIHETCLEKDRL